MTKYISVTMWIEAPAVANIENEINWKLNAMCSLLEGLKCSVFYKMKDSNGKEIHLELP